MSDKRPLSKVGIKGDTIVAELWYPRTKGEPAFINIGLVDVRASDGIRVHYDFDRDGWVIEQPTKLCWKSEEEPDMAWKEVAFVRSWQLSAVQEVNDRRVQEDPPNGDDNE